eukprot:sb/3462699/
MTEDSPPNLQDLISRDPYLEPHKGTITDIYRSFSHQFSKLLAEEDSLGDLLSSYERYGIRVQPDNSVKCREWAPNLSKLCLAGDFNDWNKGEYVFKKSDRDGEWELVIPPSPSGECVIPMGTELRYFCTDHQGNTFDRISPWALHVQQGDRAFYNEVMVGQGHYEWSFTRPKTPSRLYIYEAHVGIASPEPRIASYIEFADNVIPRIAKLGYNCIQLMAIMEHAYYASFGYQVTSFFAPSSRFGDPDSLRYLVDTAHRHGLVVLLDLVHSHASSNTVDGLNSFDGSDSHYFLEGPAGNHAAWGSRIFDYSKPATLRFLLSNLHYWVTEFRFDGFRFDGVTSMLYHHHGVGHGFTGNYGEYFNNQLNRDAVNYLQLCNKILHDMHPQMITIAEDVSGLPGLCRPVSEGGVGFDYRLAMSIPDMWIKLIKECSTDAQWDLGNIVWTLNNRRWQERNIAYCESHDQALVGDKTLAFWLMDSEMYTNMSVLSELTPRIERGISLHKMIRLITFSLGGEGVLTFMGNEFGHPEWLDFPREGNNSSYHYCRRQFNLPADDTLRYKFLERWEGAMLGLEREHPWLDQGNGYVFLTHESDRVVVFERGGLCFVFNFHWSTSYTGYRTEVNRPGKWKVVLDSDHGYFGGQGRVDGGSEYFTMTEDGRYYIQTYLPVRTCLVYRMIDEE